MLSKEIAKRVGVDVAQVENFIFRANIPHSVKGNQYAVDDSYVKAIADFFNPARQTAEKEMFNGILITSGYNFDGYKIIKYSEYISGDDLAWIPASKIFAVDAKGTITKALSIARENAVLELKKKASSMGCNAIIGVDFDYLTFGSQSEFPTEAVCVTANGTAVVMQKID